MSFAQLKLAFDNLCISFRPKKEFDADNAHFLALDPDDMLTKEYKVFKSFIKDLRDASQPVKFKTYTDGFAIFDESGCLYCYRTTFGMPLIGFALTETPEELTTAIDAYSSRVQSNIERTNVKLEYERTRPRFRDLSA